MGGQHAAEIGRWNWAETDPTDNDLPVSAGTATIISVPLGPSPDVTDPPRPTEQSSAGKLGTPDSGTDK
jgi:hypothetical protein